MEALAEDLFVRTAVRGWNVWEDEKFFAFFGELQYPQCADGVEVQSFTQRERKFGFGGAMEDDVEVLDQLLLVFRDDVQILLRNVARYQADLVELFRGLFADSVKDLSRTTRKAQEGRKIIKDFNARQRQMIKNPFTDTQHVHASALYSQCLAHRFDVDGTDPLWTKIWIFSQSNIKRNNDDTQSAMSQK